MPNQMKSTYTAIVTLLLIVALFVIGLLITDKSYCAYIDVIHQIKEKQLTERVIIEHEKAKKNYVVTLKRKVRK